MNSVTIKAVEARGLGGRSPLAKGAAGKREEKTNTITKTARQVSKGGLKLGRPIGGVRSLFFKSSQATLAHNGGGGSPG